jgi:ankyrin repeat protein
VGAWYIDFSTASTATTLGTEETMSKVTKLHSTVKHGDLTGIKALLDENRDLANSRSETDARGTYPLHVAAEFGQADAARLLLKYGADVGLLDSENDAIALGWAAFFGRPEVVAVLLEAGSEPSQRNKNGLTPLGCAVGGTKGRWKKFSDATIEDWQRAVDIIRAYRGVE